MEKRILIFTQIVDKNDSILGFFHKWIEEFSMHYNEVIVVCLKKGTYDLPDNVIVKSLGKEQGVSKIVYIWRFYTHVMSQLFIKKKLERIFVHMNEIYILLLIPLWIVRKIKSVPLYWWKAHGKLSLLSRCMVYFTDRIVTSAAVGFNIKTSKRVVIGQGIDVDLFSLKTVFSNEKRIIIAVGRISPVKGYDELIKAAAFIRKRNNDVLIKIVGGEVESSPDYLAELKQMVKKYGVGDIVEFVSPVDQTSLVKKYQKADLVVSMTKTDSLEKVVLEGMSCGLVPVCTNQAYASMLGDFKLIAPRNSPEEFANVILNVLKKNKSEIQELGLIMRDIVVKKHSISFLIKKIIDI